jgi:adenosylcobyric acid synthase
VSASGRVAGTYLHGCLAADGFRRAFLARLGAAPGNLSYEAEVEAVLDGLAAHLETALDLNLILSLSAQVAD